MPIIANLVIGHEGATTVAGQSSGLSTGSDRMRFHQIRTLADAILIGGSTARAEPYERTPVPLYVCTNSERPPGSAAANPKAVALRMSPSHAIAAALREHKTILIEAGPNFLESVLKASLVDTLYLTRVSKSGDGPLFTLDPTTVGLSLVEEQKSLAGNGSEEDIFQVYARLPTK